MSRSYNLKKGTDIRCKWYALSGNRGMGTNCMAYAKDKRDLFCMPLKSLNYNFRCIFHKYQHFSNINSSSHRYISSRTYYFLTNNFGYIRCISHPKSRKGMNQGIFCRSHYSCKNHRHNRCTSRDQFMCKRYIQADIGSIYQLIKGQNLNNTLYSSQYYMSGNFKHLLWHRCILLSDIHPNTECIPEACIHIASNQHRYT